MDSSATLLSSQIQFLDTQLALIHIPLHLYSNFLQPILQLLLPAGTQEQEHATNGHHKPPRPPWAYIYPFVNISITPSEVSIACSRCQADVLFVPVRDSLDEPSKKQVTITAEDYVVMSIDGAGLEAGLRTLELTSPLAMAGIPILFISTYFSDYIIVPLRCRATVIQELESRGFVFNSSSKAYVNPSHNRHPSSTSSVSAHTNGSTPSTPPPATISELQTRTFATLAKRNIAPSVDASLRLVQAGGLKESARPATSNSASSGGTSSSTDSMLVGIFKCLLTCGRPQFFSLTHTDAEPVAFLLEKRLLSHFPDAVLLGDSQDILVPIILDLRELPLESTGIVCGVAGRLVGGTQEAMRERIDMGYLSTAKAGTVMVPEAELQRAMEALNGVPD